jgi:drug/metabolite transporter (DMT)-like permease
MPANRALKIKTYVVLAWMVFFTTAGNALLDKGMKGVGALDFSAAAAVHAGLAHMMSSGVLWLGALCMTLFLLCHMLVLSWADYSFVMPFSALGYVLVPLVGVLWFGEVVHTTRWIGIGLIVFGVVLVGRTPPATTAPAPAATLPGAAPR